jgi:Putative prokaryotic signal transducing protein
MSTQPPHDGELVAVAFVRDEVEGEMLRGLLEGEGIPSMVRAHGISGRLLAEPLLNPQGSSGSLLVRAEHAEEARALLGETLVEDEEATWPEPANARYLEAASGGRGPRSYGWLGAYARISAVSLAAFAVMFGVFLLFRAL